MRTLPPPAPDDSPHPVSPPPVALPPFLARLRVPLPAVQPLLLVPVRLRVPALLLVMLLVPARLRVPALLLLLPLVPARLRAPVPSRMSMVARVGTTCRRRRRTRIISLLKLAE